MSEADIIREHMLQTTGAKEFNQLIRDKIQEKIIRHLYASKIGSEKTMLLMSDSSFILHDASTGGLSVYGPDAVASLIGYALKHHPEQREVEP